MNTKEKRFIGIGILAVFIILLMFSFRSIYMENIRHFDGLGSKMIIQTPDFISEYEAAKRGSRGRNKVELEREGGRYRPEDLVEQFENILERPGVRENLEGAKEQIQEEIKMLEAKREEVKESPAGEKMLQDVEYLKALLNKID
jgi:hypothetical protein